MNYFQFDILNEKKKRYLFTKIKYDVRQRKSESKKCTCVKLQI